MPVQTEASMAHYSLISLQKGTAITVAADTIQVRLDAVEGVNPIECDQDFLQAVDSGHYFWVSGGGTYLINGRYLPLVKRSDGATVNPGIYSLFTGRSDSKAEWLNPLLLVRELFEECILFEGDTRLLPVCPAVQPVIDTVMAKTRFLTRTAVAVHKEWLIDPVEIAHTTISVTNNHQTTERRAFVHCSSRNDINVISLFAAQADIATLQALDGEYHMQDDMPVFHNRHIYLYDIVTAQAVLITRHEPRQTQRIDFSMMSEHCAALIAHVALTISRTI